MLAAFRMLRSVRLTAIFLLMLAMLPAQAEVTAYNRGVEAFRAKNYAEARRMWTQAIADGGPDEAFNNLAFLLFRGMGGDAAPDKAVALWRKGAALSVSESQLHLGQAYEDGRGVDQDRVRALAWYLCAAATAHRLSAADATEQSIEQGAQTAEAELRVKLSDAQVAEARRLAEQLIARYSQRLDDTTP